MRTRLILRRGISVADLQNTPRYFAFVRTAHLIKVLGEWDAQKKVRTINGEGRRCEAVPLTS